MWTLCFPLVVLGHDCQYLFNDYAQAYNLNYIINILLPLLRAEALRTGHDIQIDMGDIPDIDMDEKEIRQLILNLVRNGFEAMETGGILTIGTHLERWC